ncbi:golgi transport complex component Cog5 [Rhizodiscina lignyota]|uniref:Conserved oligomeric Golgi complex subunit 5 n=1 Tax=Rhizodiscina lignyota TaxID=1504668 RepID=A0A9P4IEE9_9PEZI|nr:golgi transport complex component Cog5 [Rhizodiscina lignyota]
MADEDPSYIDYEAFLDPSFSPTSFANTLVLSTNNPSDTPLDLSTPLSRVLFDVQEIDTHIDTLTTKSALPLLDHTREQSEAGNRLVDGLEAQVATLTDAYKTLEKEVIDRYEAADQVRVAAERLCATLKLGRAVGRCLMLGRQLEAQVTELTGGGITRKGDHRAMVRASNTLLGLRQLLEASKPGEEGEGLERVNVVNSLRSEVISPSELTVLSRAQQTVREFSMSSLLAAGASAPQASGGTATFAQTEDTKSRTTSALLTLYLLSPASRQTIPVNFAPKLLISALQEYLQTALKSSLAAISRSLATLPTLDRTLLEISARCQNIVALEALLESIKAPPHPLFDSAQKGAKGQTTMNFLQPLLQSLDTSSLPSYFWRSLASALSPRVQEIMNRGGVSSRTLRSNKDRVRDALRECVNRGSQLPAMVVGRGKGAMVGHWEREAAVMVGAVFGVLGR